MQFGNLTQFLVSSATEFLYMPGFDDVRRKHCVRLGFSQGASIRVLTNIFIARIYASIKNCTLMCNTSIFPEAVLTL